MKFYVLGHYVKTIQINIKTPNRETCNTLYDIITQKLIKLVLEVWGTKKNGSIALKRKDMN